MTSLARIVSVLLRASLALFPARYRREYGEERACVLGLALEEADAGGWLLLLRFCAREWRDLPIALLREHGKEWRVRMELDGNQLEAEREPGYTVWIGLLPFVILGAMVMSFEVPREWGDQNLLSSLNGLLMFGGYLVILVGFLLGALAGFPRWSFPYLIYGFLFSFFLSNGSTPGLVVFNIEMWGRELWGWRAWVPLGIVIFVIWLLNRYPGKLLDKLWGDVAKNWSRLTFGLYGLLPLAIFISFDEMDKTYSFPGAVVGAILLIIGAFLYLRLKAPFWRTFSLIAFAFLGILAVKAAVHLYWDTHSINIITDERRLLEGPVPYGKILGGALRESIGAVLFLLLPAVGKLLGFIHQLGQRITKRLSHSG